ncbi:MAG: aldo/keto reductase [Chloroflexi bacterium]|nr:aldo/keto reductase [Chloroflexota bacterium]
MEFRRLGRTNLNVSLVGLGSGGRSRLGQAHGLAQQDVTRIVRRALDLGINLIDTAPAYGESEALLGTALDGVSRESYSLCTKFMPVQDGALMPSDALRTSLEESLRRLRTDRLEVLYLHGVRPEWHARVLERFREPLEQARRDGLIRFLGVTENFQDDHAHGALQAVLPLGLFDVIMVGYNVLSPAPAHHVLPRALADDIGVVIMCAVRGVLLRPERIREVVGEWKDQGILPRDAVPDHDPLGWLLGPWADTIPAAAYKFAAAHPAVGCVLTGTGRLEHLEENVRAILGPGLPPDRIERAIATFAPVSRNASF